jgi:nucleotide-binding universal stress UspA family protein
MQRVHLRKIMCAVDLSDRSVATLRRAWNLARLHGAEVVALHVSETPPVPPGAVQRSAADVFQHLRRVVQDDASGGAVVRWVTAHGDPAIEVARHVRSAQCDLVVMGRSVPRSDEPAVGVIEETILRTTECPVLIMPAVAGRDASAEPFREILCGVSSGLSTTTLRYALSFAQEFEGRLTILNVEQDGSRGGDNHPWIQSELDRLRAVIPDTADEWCEIDEIVARGYPAEELGQAARRLNADLVVMGTSGLPALVRDLGHGAFNAQALARAHLLIVPTPAALLQGSTPAPLAHA